MKNLQSVVPIPAPVPQRQATGLHLIGDLYGCLCDSRLMLDAAHLESFCKERVAAAGDGSASLSAYLTDVVFADAAASIAAPEPADVAGFATYLDRYRAGLAVEAAAVAAL